MQRCVPVSFNYLWQPSLITQFLLLEVNSLIYARIWCFYLPFVLFLSPSFTLFRTEHLYPPSFVNQISSSSDTQQIERLMDRPRKKKKHEERETVFPLRWRCWMMKIRQICCAVSACCTHTHLNTHSHACTHTHYQCNIYTILNIYI